MIKTMIDDLRAHRDRIDEAITALEKAISTTISVGSTTDEDAGEVRTKHRYTRRIKPIVAGSSKWSTAARRILSEKAKARWKARRAKGFNNLG